MAIENIIIFVVVKTTIPIPPQHNPRAQRLNLFFHHRLRELQNGNAIRTEPGGNAPAAKGSTVKIVCSQGASPTPTPTPTPSPSTSASSGGGGFIGGLGGPTTSPGANGGGH